MFGLNASELKLLRRLNTPAKIQDWLETVPANFEPEGDTLISPRRVIRERRAHCLEGALLAAAALWVNGERPLLLDLKTVEADFYHVVALFRRHGRWGAISKSNHAVLRYREPIFRTVRELALSYFHGYFLNDGRKTLRSYARPLDLRRFAQRQWLTDESDLWYIGEALDDQPHYPLLDKKMTASLRRADPLEIKAGRITQWKRRR